MARDYKIGLHKATNAQFLALTRHGLPKNMQSMKPYLLDTHLRPFTSEVQGLRPKQMTLRAQTEAFEALYRMPFRSPYVACIASKPNDNAAKLMAGMLMMKAFKVYNKLKEDKTNARHKYVHNRAMPFWHTLTGNWADEFRDKKIEGRPSLLFLANVHVQSSSTKLEKLRDILEMYSGVPRIVVLAGEDPVTFFNTKMFYGLNHAILLCKPNVVKDHEL